MYVYIFGNGKNIQSFIEWLCKFLSNKNNVNILSFLVVNYLNTRK